MRRVGVILLVIFEAIWLNAFLPGHTRGIVTIGESTCCASKHKDKKSEQQDRVKHCAVCFFAARLTSSPTLVIELPPLAKLDEAPPQHPIALTSVNRIAVFDSRGPPSA
jgi:hypothetical protein